MFVCTFLHVCYYESVLVIQPTGTQGFARQRCRSLCKEQLERDSRGCCEDTQSAVYSSSPSATPDAAEEGSRHQRERMKNA